MRSNGPRATRTLAPPDAACSSSQISRNKTKGHPCLALGRAGPHTPHRPGQDITLPWPETEPNSRNAAL